MIIMEMSKNIFRLTCLTILLIHQSLSCWYAKDYNRTVCNSFMEAAAEADGTWDRLNVFNQMTQLSLTANNFLRMRNLIFLQVSNVKTIQIWAFKHLKKLEELILYNNTFQLNSARIIGYLPLWILTIRGNPNIKNLHGRFFIRLPKLRQIDFRDNDFGVIHNNIFSRKGFHTINLDCNKIHTIEDDVFVDMPVLIQLSFTGNLLTSFESKRILGNSNSLRVIWLSKNQLTKINHSVLEGLPLIEKLYFEVNKIEYIEENVCQLTPHLKYLDLSNNKLREIPPNIFPLNGMKQLEQFFLHNNRLTFLNKALFYRLLKLKHITYGGNPFQCSCLIELKRIIETTNIASLCDSVYYLGERPTCIFPTVPVSECIYDSEQTENMYQIYHRALKNYPKLEQKCDTDNGIENATLREVS